MVAGMCWKTKLKTTKLRTPTPHPPSKPHLIGRIPAELSVRFSPLQLFTACARASRLYVINPNVMGPEAFAIQAYLENTIKEEGDQFAINFDPRLKDSSKTYFSGLVGDGIAYLTMIENGYSWFDHFEISVPKPKGRRPDFVFTDTTGDLALVEAKGTRSTSLSVFDKTTVKNAYVSQIEPHFETLIDGQMPVRGFAVGSHLRGTTVSHVVVHCTAEHVGQPPSDDDMPRTGSAAIKSSNYMNGLALIYGPEVGPALRNGHGLEDFEFSEFSWLGRRWLTRDGLSPLSVVTSQRSSLLECFALEKTRVEALFRGIWERSSKPLEVLEPISSDLMANAGRESQSVIFPDGFAAISKGEPLGEIIKVRWNAPQSTADSPLNVGVNYQALLDEDELPEFEFVASETIDRVKAARLARAAISEGQKIAISQIR